MNYINHITLSTGHCRQSPRSEVGDETLAILAPWLDNARQSGNIEPLPVAPLSHYGARVLKEVGLVVTIYGPRGPHTPGQPHAGEWLPLVTLGIAQRSRESGDLWAHMLANFKGAPGIKAPATPWVAVSIHETAMAYPEALEWLGDLERCIAWAWITRNPAIKPVESPNPQRGNKMTMIVWNGCDNYVVAAEAVKRGYDFDGEKLYHGGHEFKAFEATEIDPSDLPKDEDGEPDFTGVFGTECGKFYK